ncbi:MgtC/SapB family protein [Candidatus Peregrinibacteria bacterium]|nr:MgtC/SapB family protein [Candidatus Peregrinibacteria bacterium]
MSTEILLARMGLSLACGMVIGWDRERKHKPAGVRTITLVCMGSTLMMLTALLLTHEAEGASSDVIRMLQGIVTGIGFLGAGTVIQLEDRVQGLTTAAAIWITGAIGAAVGAGYYALAMMGTLLALAIISLNIKNGFPHP